MNAVKRILNLILIMIGVVLILICADLMTNKLIRTDLESLDETDRCAIEEICGVTALFDDRYGNELIWNENYNLRSNSAIITRRYGLIKGYSYAVNMTAAKSIFAQRIEMPEEYSDIPVYRYCWLYPQSFAFSSREEAEFEDVGGIRTYTAAFDAQNVKMNGTGSLEEEYIENTFVDTVESVDVPENPNDDTFELTAENVALMGLQYRLIDDMLNAPDSNKLDELIAEYVTVREYQAEHYAGSASGREEVEIREGCARYVFYNISEKLGHNLTYFNKEKNEAITFYSAYYYLCTGRYNSDVTEFLNYTGRAYEGAALCRIIADNELVDEWYNMIDGEKPTSQYTILRDYIAKKPDAKKSGKNTDITIDDIKRMYNYDEIISMARTLVNAVD